MRVAQGMAMQRPVKGRREKHSAPAQQLMAISHLFGRVVIPADGKDGLSQATERHQEIAHDADGLRRGLGLVVEIARKQHCVAFFSQFHRLAKHGPLVLQQTETIEPAPDMQIGQMQKRMRFLPSAQTQRPAGLWYLFFSKRQYARIFPFQRKC